MSKAMTYPTKMTIDMTKFEQALAMQARNLKMTITKDEIIIMATTWRNYNGWTGETCGQCKIEANVLAGGPGWFCEECESYNAQSLSNFNIPHLEPAMGPSQAIIKEAHEEANIDRKSI